MNSNKRTFDAPKKSIQVDVPTGLLEEFSKKIAFAGTSRNSAIVSLMYSFVHANEYVERLKRLEEKTSFIEKTLSSNDKTRFVEVDDDESISD